jgi:Fur family zinc uptake transcriptional regulator
MVAQSLAHRSSEAVAAALRAAEDLCRQRSVRFTPMRRMVLECLWQSPRAIGAYDLIRILEARLGRQLSPPSVYRALDFLLEQGLVSRLETMNAFVPSAHPDHHHACVFFICEHCGSSAEVENAKLESLLSRDAAALGFRVDKRVVELQGLCAHCVSTELANS